MLTLNEIPLHSATSDGSLTSMRFLNEIIDRYPDAISFAPGAPNPHCLEEFDVARYLSTYARFLAAKKHLTDSQIRRHLHQYGPSQGLINELIAYALRLDLGIAVRSEDIVVTVGCQEGLVLILRALCASPRDCIAVVEPCFIGILGAAALLNVKIQPIQEINDEIDFDQLRAVCRAARAKGDRIRALYIAPDFSNPSGSWMGLQARQRLIALSESEDFLIIEDNTYGFTAPIGLDIPTLKALDRQRRVIYCCTFAKICIPAARVGFVIADQEVLARSGRSKSLASVLADLKSVLTVNTSPICQAMIGGAILEHGGSIRCIGETRSLLYRRNMQHLLAALNRSFPIDGSTAGKVTWNMPRGGFFLRMKLPIVVDETLLEISARVYGVLWTPMAYFYVGQMKSNELRLSCSYLETTQIDEGVARLSQFLHDPVVISV